MYKSYSTVFTISKNSPCTRPDSTGQHWDVVMYS